MKTILVVEDDPRIQKALTRLFASEGYEIQIAADGQAGLAASRTVKPAAVVLDLMLPGINGRDLCRLMKEGQPETPVIILSAVSEVADKVLLLELGADDYVTKPFSPRELLARVEAAIRRSAKSSSAKLIQFEEIAIDAAKMEVRRDGVVVTLTAHECRAGFDARRVAERCLGLRFLSKYANGGQPDTEAAPEAGARPGPAAPFSYRAWRGI